MRSYLDYKIEEHNKFYKKKCWVSVLNQISAEQNIIRKWCKNANIPKQHPDQQPVTDIFNYKDLPNDVKPCEEWEARLLYIAAFFEHFFELSEWEKMLSSERFDHSKKIAKKARELADLLEISKAPYYPPALELFDSERAVDIIRALPKKTAEALLGATGYSVNSKTGYAQQKRHCYLDTPERRLASRFLFPETQRLSSLLRNLAEYADNALKEPKRDKRPNTSSPNARAFARHLSDNFELFFHRTPNEVIAACVCIRYPELPDPPNEETIRDWRGVK